MKENHFFAATLMFLFILIIVNIAVVHNALTHFEMKGQRYTQVGMMEYVNPEDHKKLYFLMYEKGDK